VEEAPIRAIRLLFNPVVVCGRLKVASNRSSHVGESQHCIVTDKLVVIMLRVVFGVKISSVIKGRSKHMHTGSCDEYNQDQDDSKLANVSKRLPEELDEFGTVVIEFQIKDCLTTCREDLDKVNHWHRNYYPVSV
jgi:hypothetical protein